MKIKDQRSKTEKTLDPSIFDLRSSIFGFAAPPRVSWFWPVGCLLAILYVSLLPFDFSLTALDRAIVDGLVNLRFRSTTSDDAVTNLLVYLPVGLVLGLYALRARWKPWVGVLGATLVGTTLSILVETLQTGLASRVASCTDILLNCVGTATGACLGIGLSQSARRAWTQVRIELVARPFTTAASMLTLGLFLYDLAPFDFVMTTNELHASFARANWGLMSARVATVGAPPFAAMAHQLAGAGWFAVLGFLLALGGRERGRRPEVSLGSALKDGLILAALVEFMQLLTRSHTFDAATILIRSFGVAFGAWCAVFMIDFFTRSGWRQRSSLALPTGLIAILAVFQIALLMAPCVNPQGGSSFSIRALAIEWLPFETLWRLPWHKATTDVLSALMTYGTLALTLGALLRRLGFVHARCWAFGALIVVATACEGLRLSVLGTPLDVTTLLLACVAAYLVMRLGSAMADTTATQLAGHRSFSGLFRRTAGPGLPAVRPGPESDD